MPSERVSRERRKAVKAAMDEAFDAETVSREYWDWDKICAAMAIAAIQTILPDRTAFFDAVDELVDVIKGFESDSTIEDKKIALRGLVYGDDDASGGTR